MVEKFLSQLGFLADPYGTLLYIEHVFLPEALEPNKRQSLYESEELQDIGMVWHVY